MQVLIEKIQKWVQENKGFLAFICGIVLMRSVLLDMYQVPSGSMIPAIAIGDRLLVNKSAYQFRFPFSRWILFKTGEPQRGEIVVFDHPSDSKVMVKRLIGLPGDKVTVINGKVFINDQPATIGEMRDPAQPNLAFFKEELGEHRFLVQRIPYRARMMGEAYQEFEVPENSYFFMGDNRDNSRDSRAWGFVARELLKGKALRVTFSQKGFSFAWNRFGQNLYTQDLNLGAPSTDK